MIYDVINKLIALIKSYKLNEKPPKQIALAIATTILLLIAIIPWGHSNVDGDIPLAKAETRSFAIDIRTVGELEAKKSTGISSPIRGDQGKIIYIIPDGQNVNEEVVLLKMDPTPFEEKIEKLTGEVVEQQAYIEALAQTLEWEINQGEHERKTCEFETSSAALELDRIKHGDGPLEIAKFKAALHKAWIKYDELNGYSNDLIALEEQGFLNTVERKQAEKKLDEEKEAYENAKLQYESYVEHVHPMQVRKAETALKQCIIKQEEQAKTRGYKIGKAQGELEQARHELKSIEIQLKEAYNELTMSEIKAPAPGMVVHKDDYRSGQKRKPRVGDVLVKNQPIIELPDLSQMTVKTKVREIDLYKIAIGKSASIEVDAFPSLTLTGKVISIGILAISDMMRPSEEKYFEVKIAVDQSDSRLRPGMTSRVVIHADQLSDVLTVPVHALFEEERKLFCYVASFSGFKKRPIEVGALSDQWAEIKSGLKSGERVSLINPTLVQK